MNNTIIWIDRTQAKIFSFIGEGIHKKQLEGRRTEHHTHRPDQIDKMHQENKLFQEVVDHLRDSDGILVVGPGIAKYHFRTYLMEHCPSIAKKILHCETVDHPTEAQLIAMGKKTFVMDQ